MVDLGSRTGLGWPGGATGSGWLDVGSPVRIGPFQLRLRSPVAARPTAFPLAYNPIQSDPDLSRSYPTVTLEFRNGKRAKDRWTVNRLLTPIGRLRRVQDSPDCRRHCRLPLRVSPFSGWCVGSGSFRPRRSGKRGTNASISAPAWSGTVERPVPDRRSVPYGQQRSGLQRNRGTSSPPNPLPAVSPLTGPGRSGSRFFADLATDTERTRLNWGPFRHRTPGRGFPVRTSWRMRFACGPTQVQ